MRLYDFKKDKKVSRALEESTPMSNSNLGPSPSTNPAAQQSPDVALAQNMSQNINREREMLRQQIQDTEKTLRELRRRLAELGN